MLRREARRSKGYRPGGRAASCVFARREKRVRVRGRKKGGPRRSIGAAAASKNECKEKKKDAGLPRARLRVRRRRRFLLQRQLRGEDGAREDQLLLLPDGFGLFLVWVWVSERKEKRERKEREFVGERKGIFLKNKCPRIARPFFCSRYPRGKARKTTRGRGRHTRGGASKERREKREKQYLLGRGTRGEKRRSRGEEESKKKHGIRFL